MNERDTDSMHDKPFTGSSGTADSIAAPVDCPTCHGASTVDPDPNCPTCGGEGEVTAFRDREAPHSGGAVTPDTSDAGEGTNTATPPVNAASDVDFDEEDEEYMDDGYDCTWCCGEGEFWGNELPGYDPGWHLPDKLYPCPACKGTGARKDQVLF